MGHGGSRELSDLVSVRARTSQLLATSQGNDHFSFVEKPLKAFFLLLVRDRIQGTSRGSVYGSCTICGPGDAGLCCSVCAEPGDEVSARPSGGQQTELEESSEGKVSLQHCCPGAMSFTEASELLSKEGVMTRSLWHTESLMLAQKWSRYCRSGHSLTDGR